MHIVTTLDTKSSQKILFINFLINQSFEDFTALKFSSRTVESCNTSVLLVFTFKDDERFYISWKAKNEPNFFVFQSPFDINCKKSICEFISQFILHSLHIEHNGLLIKKKLK